MLSKLDELLQLYFKRIADLQQLGHSDVFLTTLDFAELGAINIRFVR